MPNPSLIAEWRQRWNRSLMQFLRRRLRAPADIEDLAQETYLRLLRARDLTDVRNPQAYILKIAGHVIAEWQGRQLPQGPLSLVDDPLLASGDAAEAEFEAQLMQARLDRVLAQAPVAMRAVLLLRFRDDCSQTEIAEKLGMTERQAHRHLLRGYEYLRQAFKDLNGAQINE